MHKPGVVLAAIAIAVVVAAVVGVLAIGSSDKRMQAIRDKFR
jgi:hypothetical protein